MKKEHDNEMMKIRNAQLKSNRNIKYQQRKEDILRRNQEDYQRIRYERQRCFEEKNMIKESSIMQKQE